MKNPDTQIKIKNKEKSHMERIAEYISGAESQENRGKRKNCKQ